MSDRNWGLTLESGMKELWEKVLVRDRPYDSSFCAVKLTILGEHS